MKEPNGRKVAVIGAGIAGLAGAARLAAKGFSVHLFDKNETPGGKLGFFTQNGYAFDTGPSLFTQPWQLEQLFSDCGKNLADYLTFSPLDISTHYFWEDGKTLPTYTNHDLLAAAIEQRLKVDPRPTLRHLALCRVAFEAIGSIFLDEPIHELKTWLQPRILKALRQLRLPWLTQSMHAYHTHVLNHPHLIQLFDRFATYNGSDPNRAPAMLCMIAHLEMNEGIAYPHGGMIAIVHALYRLCLDLGVQVHLQTPVLAITTSHQAATGLQTRQGTLATDYVLAAGDIHYVYTNLLKQPRHRPASLREERSDSAFVFYWGLRGQRPQLGLHNILFSADKHISNNIYINITAKQEPSGAHAPPDAENWFMMFVAPPHTRLDEAKRSKALEVFARTQVKTMLGFDPLPEIEVSSILTPALIEQQTLAYQGALYGTASNHPMAAFARHPNRHRHLQNLFFAGGTVHPGGGIPLCLRSARIASQMIWDQSKK